MATRTLSELTLLYTDPDPKIEAALLATSTPDKFGRRGAQIDSLRVLTDVRKIFPTAIEVWEGADAEQRALLTGVGRGVLCVCVDQWGRLEEMWATQEEKITDDRGVREAGTVSRADAHQTAMLARTRAAAALDCLAGQDLQRRLAVDVATGRADTDETLAQGLEALAALGRAWSVDPDLADLAADAGVHAGWADGLYATARALREAVESDTRRMTVQVTQARLDFQDGVLLHLLGTLIRIFDAANSSDRRIPRLFPSSTYRMFSRRRATDRTEAETEAEETAEAPEAAPEEPEVPPEAETDGVSSGAQPL